MCWLRGAMNCAPTFLLNLDILCCLTSQLMGDIVLTHEYKQISDAIKRIVWQSRKRATWKSQARILPNRYSRRSKWWSLIFHPIKVAPARYLIQSLRQLARN